MPVADWWARAVALVAVVLALPGLAYLVAENRRKRSHFRYTHESRQGGPFQQRGLQFWRWTFEGLLSNLSPEVNTVRRLYLVVWRNRRRNDSLRFGYGDCTVVDRATGTTLPLPVVMAPRESRSVRVTFEIVLTGTGDDELISAASPLPGHPGYLTWVHEYELAVEDVSETLFDMNGDIRNRRELDLRWTRGNAEQQKKKGKRFAVVKHDALILRTRLAFRLRIIGRAVGLAR